MHPDDLRVVWRCHDCGRSFVFNSDADDHVREFDHKMETLEITSKKIRPSGSIHGQRSVHSLQD